MRKVLVVALVVLAVAACSGGPSKPPQVGSAGNVSAPATTKASRADAKVNCAKVKASIGLLAFPGVQIFGQIRAQDAIDAIRSKQSFASTFDIDVFLAAIADLHVLNGFHQPGFDDAKAALDELTAASTRVKAMLNGPAEVPQADIDAFNTAYPITQLLAKQTAVIGASVAAGCG